MSTPSSPPGILDKEWLVVLRQSTQGQKCAWIWDIRHTLDNRDLVRRLLMNVQNFGTKTSLKLS